VVWLVSHWGLHPALANVPAWLAAFLVSFVGHHRWTFGDQRTPARKLAGRFFLVSAAGFAVNESAYVALMHWSTVRYDVVLAAVLVAVAALTYLASRHWVFLGNRAG
jgi:putative flippase GtrA